MSKFRTIRRAIRLDDPRYTAIRLLKSEPLKKLRQEEMHFHDWEEMREPRAFGPPGRRMNR